VVDVSWQACLTYDVESRLVRQLCEQELKLPYLRISTDYSPSDAARIALRVEATYETVRVPPVLDSVEASLRTRLEAIVETARVSLENEKSEARSSKS
jgi:NH3-dependent NAD+ synthetase